MCRKSGAVCLIKLPALDGVAKLSQHALARLGARAVGALGVRVAPSAATVHRVIGLVKLPQGRVVSVSAGHASRLKVCPT